MADDEKKEEKPFPLLGVDPNAPKGQAVDYDTITDKELIALMKANASEILLIDVRDPDEEEGDFIGGHIKGAINIPTFDFVDNLPELITAKNVSEKKNVVIYGMNSKARGPQSYRLYMKAKQALISADDKKDNQRDWYHRTSTKTHKFTSYDTASTHSYLSMMYNMYNI